MPWFRFYRTERLVTCYYFYIHDRRMGAAFIKVCCYAPYPVKVWCNGHEIARRAALAEGIAVTPLANGFAATSDPARLQELCDLVQAGTVRVFFETWMSRIPLPLTDADRDHGCWWQLSMRQVEVSRTLVFDDPRRVRSVFEELLAGNINLGRPEHVEVIFGSKVTRRIAGVLARRCGNGLIERIGRTNTYRLTADGLTFALVYSRVHDQVLYPLTAHDQPIAAPAPVRAAWRTITRHIDSTVAATRLGHAA